MDFIKKKAEIYKQQNLLSKIRWIKVWSNLKKKCFFSLDQKWQLMSSFIQAHEKGAKKAKNGLKNGLYQNKNWNI